MLLKFSRIPIEIENTMTSENIIGVDLGGTIDRLVLERSEQKHISILGAAALYFDAQMKAKP